MKFSLRFSLLLLVLGINLKSFAVIVTGVIYDYKTNEPMSNVNIRNIFTERGMTTDKTGKFSIDVEKGHLLEFTSIGYKTVRVRIDNLNVPFYKIAMKEGAYELQNVDVTASNYKTDSIEKREVYKWAIDHYTLGPIESIQHPFDALSKRNRQIWAFQKRYEYFEKEKFVDYIFNERLIHKIGNIDSTQMEDFRRFYRPTYDQINAWTEYQFLEYIKNAAADFKRRRG